MKYIKIIFLGFGIVWLTAISCKKEIKCIEGEVIGYEQCEKATLIKIINVKGMGSKISYHNNAVDTIYENIIKTPNLYPLGKIYFNYRRYNEESDIALFQFDPPKICDLVYGPYNVPIIVITSSSQTNCP